MAKKRKAKTALTPFAKATKKMQGKKLGVLSKASKKLPSIDPVWDLDRDGVTYSFASKFLGCRHRAHISYVQGWKPRKINFPLEFGNVFHLMQEGHTRGIPFEQLPRIAANYVNGRIREGMNDPKEVNELSMLAGVCAVTYQRYVEFWERHNSFSYPASKGWKENKFDWFASEQAFRVPYVLSNGRKLDLCGKFDGGFTIPVRNSRKFLFETKTKGDIDEEGISSGLHKDLQTGLYMLAMQIRYGEMPGGVLYNLIRRTQLKPRVNDDAITFTKRVDEDLQKRPDFYFKRWFREINQEEMNEFRIRMLDPVLFQILSWWDSIKRNPMSPFETPCAECGGAGVKDFPTTDPCPVCQGKKITTNLLHYERPFGSYDGMSRSQRGEFFEIVTDNNYFFYEQQKFAHPELEEAEVDQYFKGVK